MEIQDITKTAVTISQEATFEETVRLMVQEKTNSLLVVDGGGVLVGEINMSDILDAIVPEYLDGDSIAAHFAGDEMFTEAVTDAKDTPVKKFMSTALTPVETTSSLMSVASIAIANHRTHIPVIDEDGRPVGMISRRGLKHIIANVLNIADNE